MVSTLLNGHTYSYIAFVYTIVEQQIDDLADCVGRIFLVSESIKQGQAEFVGGCDVWRLYEALQGLID